MSFPDAIRSVFTKYATFSGRARRSEYWFFALFVFLVNIVVSIIDAAAHTRAFYSIAALALLVPHLAVGARRLHDTNRSGWWLLIGLIPVLGWIVLIVFFVQDSNPGTNAHGPSPKEIASFA